ncbi:Very-long-chain acyl- synthetase family protein [Neofusicoccum parvum]|uniref:Very long-chain fatty acid transport protein n=2 Tax=Neofusicoccum parvum TaxID=310453 RepID=R1EC90_BOTPV|nr:putative amp dependent ligase protein [Neofusicoccum parvum UCRNP2]GME30352.1 Very-long-chain acyl- synthetase family protein [Neofusicoccum parvum]GME37477.1 Very-long-chain acyl- synthetase family protein [Neofusicoccum parvum]
MAALVPAAAAAVAGATAAAAYVDAKLHISKDLRNMRSIKREIGRFQEKARTNRTSLWYDFEAQVKRLPATEPCLWSRDGGSVTWAAAHAQACRHAGFLLERGVEPGALVAVYLQNSADFVLAVLGAWAVGSAPALINYNLGGQGLLHCLRISGARVLLVDADEGCRRRIDEVRESIEGELGMRIVVMDEETKSAIAAREPTRPERKYREGVKPTDPMCLMYTSGSTGLPKACPFEVGRAFAITKPRIEAVGLSPGPNGDRWYDCMPLYHGTGYTVAVSCLTTGITLCIGKKFSTSNFWKDVRDSDATAFVYVGETARYLLAAPKSPLDRQHRVKVMFGNGLRPDVWRKFGERFGVQTVAEFFNSTEGVFALMNICSGEFTQGSVGHHGLVQRMSLRNVYIPVEIDHETGEMYRDPKTGFARRRPYEAGGEILVQVASEKAFVGYWKNPEATRKMFVRDVFRKGDLFYRTGDALRRTSDGRWYFMDRLGDTFRWKSENVSTAEVAEVLGNYPGVNEAIVYGVEVPGHDGRAGCAALHIPLERRSSPAFYAALLAFARKSLPKYAVPIFLRITANMQPMHNNKQNKTPLKKEGIDVKKIAEGDMNEDKILWLPESLNVKGRGEGYVEFTEADLEALKAAAASPGETARL